MQLSEIKELNLPNEQIWYPYKFDKAAFQIFAVLQQQPTIPISHLASELGYSTTLVKARIDDLKAQAFLRPDRTITVPFLGRRLQSEAEAIYDPWKLGLTRVHIFIHKIATIKDLTKIEALLSIHPYCHYKVSAFDTNATIYCQFDIPQSGISHLTKLFDTLYSKEIIGDYDVLNEYGVIKTEIDIRPFITDFHIDKQVWDEVESNEIEKLWLDYLSLDNEKVEVIKPIEEKGKLDQIDLKLIRELTINARLNISETASNYEISRSRLSRRIKRLREDIIIGERLVFDTSIFDQSNGVLISGTFDPNQDFNAKSFISFLKSGIFPYRSQCALNENSFIWMIIAPPSVIAEIRRFIWQKNFQTKFYPIDLSSSETYFFYPNAYKDGSWITTEEYIVDQPLELMDQMI